MLRQTRLAKVENTVYPVIETGICQFLDDNGLCLMENELYGMACDSFPNCVNKQPPREVDPDSKTCPSCEHEIPANLMYCWGCGAPQEVKKDVK